MLSADLNPHEIRNRCWAPDVKQLKPIISQIAPKAITVFQEQRGGTGHAAQLALAGNAPQRHSFNFGR